MAKLRPLVCLGAALALLCGSSGAAQSTLRGQIAAVLDLPEYRHAHWGLLAVDMSDGAVVYERNADQLFVPASTTKLYSVATALDALGAEHRFRTPVVRRGRIRDDGTLDGDLILVASGDLTMGGRTLADGRIAFKDGDHTYANGNDSAAMTEPDPLAGLDDLADQVARAGIRRVSGDVLVDDRLFEPAQSTGSGPSTVSPILINDNVVDVLVTPAAAAGTAAAVDWRPRSLALAVDARVTTGRQGSPADVSVTSPAPGRLVVRGMIPAGRKPLLRVREVADAPSWARSLFVEALGRKGVAVDASALASNLREALPSRAEVDELPKVATLTTPAFKENARLILKVSHNLHASTLPLLVAVKHGRRTLGDGLRLQGEFLKRLGVPQETISFGGGAGGDRADMTTPRATVALLRAMAERRDFPAYDEALPILGVDGTLSTAVGMESPARGKVRAKTGTYSVFNSLNRSFLLTSKAFAGYVDAKSGKKLAIAMFVNNTHVDAATGGTREGKALGRLAEILQQAN